MSIFSENLKKFRIKENLSQRALAAEIGCSQGAIKAWENATSLPSSEFVIKLALFFGISTDELLGIETETPLNYQPAEVLTEEEKEIIKLYRELDAEDKRYLKTTFTVLFDTKEKAVPDREHSTKKHA